MKVILGSRRSGKTVRLIQECAKNGGYIVCHSKSEANRIFKISKEMKLDIPLPLIYDDIISIRKSGIKKFHLDNADHFLKYLFQRKRISNYFNRL